jgi:hypothetical protein
VQRFDVRNATLYNAGIRGSQCHFLVVVDKSSTGELTFVARTGLFAVTDSFDYMEDDGHGKRLVGIDLETIRPISSSSRTNRRRHLSSTST